MTLQAMEGPIELCYLPSALQVFFTLLERAKVRGDGGWVKSYANVCEKDGVVKEEEGGYFSA